MSTLPGSAADKAGLVHEALWGVYAMLKVLCGDADSICIEEPGMDGAEFHLQFGKTREQREAKRQVLSQENWSLQLLKSKGVLTFFLEQTRQGNSCVFASISEAPELRILSENACTPRIGKYLMKNFSPPKKGGMILTSFANTGMTSRSRKHSNACSVFELKVRGNALWNHY
jgi:hypothetical protein